MKVERKVDTHDEEYERTPRPAGKRISHSQLVTPCDLRLKFRRARVRVKNPLWVGLIYGRAFHAGIESFLRGAARTPAQAVRSALASLNDEVLKNRTDPGIRWDDYHERNLDGSISLKGNNFGALPDVDFARWWLQRQVPLWIALYGDSKVRFSEKSIYVPLTRQPKWTDDWSVECWLDFVLDVPSGGYQITDTKTSAGRWEEKDVQKNSKQALLYMGAASREFKEDPALPFAFHVLPRTKAAIPALEIAYALLDPPEVSPDELRAAREMLERGGPAMTKTVTEGKGKDKVSHEEPVVDAEGRPVQEWTVDDALQVVEIPFDLDKINTYIHGVIWPRISMIEAEAFAATPTGWHCAKNFCDYWNHCAFGEGTHL